MLRPFFLSSVLALTLLVLEVQSAIKQYKTEFTLGTQQMRADLHVSDDRKTKRLYHPMVKKNTKEQIGGLCPCKDLSVGKRTVPKSATGCRVPISCSKDSSKNNQVPQDCITSETGSLSYCGALNIGSIPRCDEKYNRIPGSEYADVSEPLEYQDGTEATRAVDYVATVGDPSGTKVIIRTYPKRKNEKTLIPDTLVRNHHHTIPCDVLSTNRLDVPSKTKYPMCKVQFFCEGELISDHHCLMRADPEAKSKRLLQCGVKGIAENSNILYCGDKFLGISEDDMFRTQMVGAEDEAGLKISFKKPTVRIVSTQVDNVPLLPCHKMLKIRSMADPTSTTCKVQLKCEKDGKIPDAHECLVDDFDNEKGPHLKLCGSPSYELINVPYCNVEDFGLDQGRGTGTHEECAGHAQTLSSDTDEEDDQEDDDQEDDQEDDEDIEMIEAPGVGSDDCSYAVHLRSARTSTSQSFAFLTFDQWPSKTILRGRRASKDTGDLDHPSCWDLPGHVNGHHETAGCQAAIGCWEFARETFRVCRLHQNDDIQEVDRCQPGKIQGLSWCNFGSPEFKDIGFVESEGKPIKLRG